jgi:hypothetical protein
MAKGHGGKRPRSGRKPKKADAPLSVGAKTANFSTRITPETRAAIEIEAHVLGLSVSAMAEVLIKRGLDARREAQRNSATRAICYLLGELAEIVAPKQLKTAKFSGDWRTDPFLFEALKLSFVRLMDALRPAGEAVPPSERDPQLKNETTWASLESIDARAERAATILHHNLTAAREPKNMLQHVPAGVENVPYALHDAWKGLNEKPSKK